MQASNTLNQRSRARLPRTVFVLGLTSLFTDVGTEMIFPLLPVFILSLGGSATFLGLIEGVADATASFLKLGSGLWADRLERRKPLVLFGYGLASLTRPFVAFATLPWHVLMVRVADRVGKGVRSAPRDVIIAAAAESGKVGQAFGFHRAMDHAGAVIGPLVATGLLALGLSVRHVFMLAIVPGVVATSCVLLVREPKLGAAPPRVASEVAGRTRAPLPRALKRYLWILLVFSLGNSSDAFLLLRARSLGVSVAAIPVLWGVFHVVKLTSAYLGGRASDRVPRTWLITIGFFIYALTYLGFGLATSAVHAWLGFCVYGLYFGLTEPAEKALIKDLAPEGLRGKAYGYYNFIIGVSAVPAGLLTGFLWQRVSPLAALATGSLLSGVAAVSLLIWARGSIGAGPRAPLGASV